MFKILIWVPAHRKYGLPRSRPHLIDHIFEVIFLKSAVFGLELPDTIVYKRSTAFVDFNFTFLFNRKVKLKSTKAIERL